MFLFIFFYIYIKGAGSFCPRIKRWRRSAVEGGGRERTEKARGREIKKIRQKEEKRKKKRK